MKIQCPQSGETCESSGCTNGNLSCLADDAYKIAYNFNQSTGISGIIYRQRLAEQIREFSNSKWGEEEIKTAFIQMREGKRLWEEMMIDQLSRNLISILKSSKD